MCNAFHKNKIMRSWSDIRGHHSAHNYFCWHRGDGVVVNASDFRLSECLGLGFNPGNGQKFSVELTVVQTLYPHSPSDWDFKPRSRAWTHAQKSCTHVKFPSRYSKKSRPRRGRWWWMTRTQGMHAWCIYALCVNPLFKVPEVDNTT